MDYSCLCAVSGGKLKIFDRADFDRALGQFANGEELELHLEPVSERHTRAQEKFFHGPILKAFMSLGNGKQEAKDMLALMFIPLDIHMLDGSIMRVPGHTSALKKDAYSKFIEECIQLAAENGIVVEDSHRRAA